MSSKKPFISVVIPVYGCRSCLHELCERIVTSLKQITDDFEIILVNDACPQNSWEAIEELSSSDQRIKGINFSKNHGQLTAILAGLDYSKGDWVVVMDCDLQNPPEAIQELYDKAVNEGYDVVFGKRRVRKDNFVNRTTSVLFNRVFNYLVDSVSIGNISNFSISSRTVVDNFIRIREQNRAFTIFIQWMGFKQAIIDIEHDYRIEGRSSYNTKKRLKLAFDIILSHSNKPLRFSIAIGFVFSIVSFVVALFYFVRYFTTGLTVAGWTSLMVAVFFIGGLILMNLGILGLYIGKVFDEAKRRPLYIVKNTTKNIDTNDISYSLLKE